VWGALLARCGADPACVVLDPARDILGHLRRPGRVGRTQPRVSSEACGPCGTTLRALPFRHRRLTQLCGRQRHFPDQGTFLRGEGFAVMGPPGRGVAPCGRPARVDAEGAAWTGRWVEAPAPAVRVPLARAGAPASPGDSTGVRGCFPCRAAGVRLPWHRSPFVRTGRWRGHGPARVPG
jgi:hypothetical protein